MIILISIYLFFNSVDDDEDQEDGDVKWINKRYNSESDDKLINYSPKKRLFKNEVDNNSINNFFNFYMSIVKNGILSYTLLHILIYIHIFINALILYY